MEHLPSLHEAMPTFMNYKIQSPRLLGARIQKLKVGDLIDVKDWTNKWYVSIVLKFRPGQVYIHYVGWGLRERRQPRRESAIATALR